MKSPAATRGMTDYQHAKYQCQAPNCGHQWVAKPGTVTCVKCGNLYVKWSNYEECSKAYHTIAHSGLEANAFGGPRK